MVRMGHIPGLGLGESQCTRACSRLGEKNPAENKRKKKWEVAGRTMNLV